MLARAAILLALAAGWCSAEWIRVSSPGVEVLTDAGEKTGRRLLARFEQIREAFVRARLIGGAAAERPWPVRALAFASEDEFDKFRYAPGILGFYTTGSERDYIALYAGGAAPRVAFHEYVHLVLNHSAVKLPAWFEEGTAEFYSTLEIQADRVRVGVPIPSHLETLARARWLTAAELAAVTTASPDYREQDRAGIFYAESWALVHMLNSSAQWGPGLPRFIEMLGHERPPDQAFREAFGQPMERAIAELPGYLPSIRLSIRTAALMTSIQAPLNPRVEKLTSVEAALERAGLALNVHRPQLARSLLEKLPESAESVAGLANLALAEGDKEQARRDFERAIALGSRDASMYFEYAMIERDRGAAPERVRDLVEKTMALNPDFADARFMAGVEETDRGNYQAAVVHLVRATQVRPQRSDYWHALAYAQWKLGDREDAMRSARRSLATAENETQTRSAEALVSLAEDPAQAASPPPIPKGPAVITPPSWQMRKGDARVEGLLTRVDCEGASARLEVQDGERTVIVEVRHPGDVELVNAPQPEYRLSCGVQRVRVAIDYIAAEREVTRIEFRP